MTIKLLPYDRLNWLLDTDSIGLRDYALQVSNEVIRLTKDLEVIRQEAERATQMWSHAEADAQAARPVVRAAFAAADDIRDLRVGLSGAAKALLAAVDSYGQIDKSSVHPALPSAESLAELFHETYERLAPEVGYRTREASAKPWAEVPEANRQLMIATCREVIAAIGTDACPRCGALEGTHLTRGCVSYRVGHRQGHNIYRVDGEHPEGVQIGCMFAAADGPLVVAALNTTKAAQGA